MAALGPKSQHVSDPALAPFLQPDFDPATFLNSTLPDFVVSSQGQQAGGSSLAELSSETQTLLATLNAQASRLTNTLTQLTDDILRTGGRLAYQVELLRGESVGLAETLNETLKDDLSVFAPPLEKETYETNEVVEKEEERLGAGDADKQSNQPHYISQLQLLTNVRTRLDSVIQIFGSAMAWPAPPIETSFISVSAPPSDEAQARAKQFSDKFRAELADLVAANDETSAMQKIGDLQTLLAVWKDTAELKSRERFLEQMGRLVQEKVQERDEPTGRRRSNDDPGVNYMGGFYP
jgi:hypothetical protein